MFGIVRAKVLRFFRAFRKIRNFRKKRLIFRSCLRPFGVVRRYIPFLSPCSLFQIFRLGKHPVMSRSAYSLLVIYADRYFYVPFERWLLYRHWSFSASPVFVTLQGYHFLTIAQSLLPCQPGKVRSLSKSNWQKQYTPYTVRSWGHDLFTLSKYLYRVYALPDSIPRFRCGCQRELVCGSLHRG